MKIDLTRSSIWHILTIFTICIHLIQAHNHAENATEESSEFRLPSAIKPLHYKIKMQPLMHSNFSILGEVEIFIKIIKPTDKLILHIEDIITKNDTVSISPLHELIAKSTNMTINIISQTYNPKNNFYTATFDQELTTGQMYVFKMKYEALLNDKFKGFYRSSYKTSDGQVRLVASTQFQDIDARKAFPCFDEPAMKARFSIYLGRQLNMSSISNMPLVSTKPIEGQPGWVWDKFDTTVPMSSYLLAFVVSDFQYKNVSTETLDFKVWSRPEAINQTDYAGVVGPKLLNYFEEYFNLSYPLPKMDMVAVPEFLYGAMENWGLVIYRDIAMLYEPGVSSADYKDYVCSVISHELAHQWFGNIVTMAWWTDIWLNEGFASYVTIIGVDKVEPTWDAIGQFVVRTTHNALRADSVESSHQVRVEIVNPKDSASTIAAIYYHKGSSLIRMMNHFLTEKTLRKGLSNYLSHFKYDNAEQDDLWHFLTMAAHEDNSLPTHMTVKDVMDTWTLQKNYPVLTVSREADGSAIITQEKFLLRRSNMSDNDSSSWWIPLTWTSQENPDFSNTKPLQWISPSMKEVLISDLAPIQNWYIFNLQQANFYRVNYDTENWNLLAEQLMKDHSVIHKVNRAQLIDDAFQLARAGILNYSIPLQMISYLNKETELIPWTAAFNNLGFIRSMFSRTAAYGMLQEYVLSLMLPIYESVGFEDMLDDPQITQLKRAKVVDNACKFGHAKCQSSSLDIFQKLMNDQLNQTIISPNQKYSIYCSAISAGGSDEWNFAYQQFLESNVASEKNTLINAMGCTKTPWLLTRFLDIAFSEEGGVKRQDARRPFASVASNANGRYIAWDYLRDNWQDIMDYIREDKRTALRLIKSGSGNMNTHRDLDELNEFLQREDVNKHLNENGISQIKETVVNRVDWMDKYYETITQWLKNSMN